MRTSLVASILISLVLIGGAIGYRVSNVQEKKVTLETIESKDIDWEDITAQITSASTTAKTEDLNKTDLIGRQLILDYIDMATAGQASDETIQALANKYADSLPTLNNARSLNAYDLRVVSDSTLNFQTYAKNFFDIHKQYAFEASKAENLNVTELNPNLINASTILSKSYYNAAEKLRLLPVPNSLVNHHLKLVNNYYSSAAAFQSIGKVDTDPAVAFAGIVTIKQNSEIESALQDEISRVLTKNGA